MYGDLTDMGDKKQKKSHTLLLQIRILSGNKERGLSPQKSLYQGKKEYSLEDSFGLK